MIGAKGSTIDSINVARYQDLLRSTQDLLNCVELAFCSCLELTGDILPPLFLWKYQYEAEEKSMQVEEAIIIWKNKMYLSEGQQKSLGVAILIVW